jgi:hypothetical protein
MRDTRTLQVIHHCVLLKLCTKLTGVPKPLRAADGPVTLSQPNHPLPTPGI